MAQKLPIFITDAFAEQAFGGNPAAVCLLKEDIDDDLKQKIATEMNLSETAFVLPIEPVATDADPFVSESKFYLRWFTPASEVPLCGHATLASAAVLFYEKKNSNKTIEFVTRMSGSLYCEASSQHATGVQMVLPRCPADAPIQEEESWAIVDACIGAENRPRIASAAISPSCKYIMVVMENEFTRTDLLKIKPDFGKMLSLPKGETEDFIAILATSLDDQNGEFDFVSRFFAPWVEINEDPVTGSAHAVSSIHWANHLNKTQLKAKQCSKRGGKVLLDVKPDGVQLTGSTAIVLEGSIRV